MLLLIIKALIFNIINIFFLYKFLLILDILKYSLNNYILKIVNYYKVEVIYYLIIKEEI